MKKSGAWLVRYALEQIGVKYTFGIPGVHNTEIYDELNNSDSITPLLVTHECGASFMADAVSRTSDHIGTLMIVPAAGVTHAASGIGEAALDGIPMLIITGGVRTDGKAYQLHDMDQHALLKPITKATFKITAHEQIVSTIYQAYDIAMRGEPGPVMVEVPVNIAMFRAEVSDPKPYRAEEHRHALPELSASDIDHAAQLLVDAKQPGIFAGWGARYATQELTDLAEWLGAPVATTLQGLSVFPANHPLHTGMGFGSYAVPAATESFKNCDAMLAVATRFSEIPTGSYGVNVPQALVHLDINERVFHANYPARVALHGDAKAGLAALLHAVKTRLRKPRDSGLLQQKIRQLKEEYRDEWFRHKTAGRVNPARFFAAAREQLADDDYVLCDDGNHTFLCAELMPIHRSGHFISPTDFNAMGYCVPAAIGTKLANPDKQVLGIVGDGAFMMTCMELVTASRNQLGLVMTVFNDGELAQIAQAQSVPYNRKTCTTLSGLNVEGVALATGCEYIRLETDSDIEDKLRQAFAVAGKGVPVILDVLVDYSKPTRFTTGIVKTNLGRFEFPEKVRFISRAIKRHITG